MAVKSSNQLQQRRGDNPNVLNITKNTPATSLHTSQSINRGKDVYIAGTRTQPIKKTLRPTEGFEPKAIIPRMAMERRGVADRNSRKMDLIKGSRI